MDFSRRQLIQGGAAAAGLCIAARAGAQELFFPNPTPPLVFGPAPAASAAPVVTQPAINPDLLARAKAALDYHRSSVPYRDFIAIADFSKASRDPRFYLVHMGSGTVYDHRVAHGRGSDPDHSGWLERFSNDFGSYASSNGAYVTGDFYEGKYGRSMRLHGLDPSNSNALDRAIVMHHAWYAEPKVIDVYGKLGRSEGCFAFSEESLYYIQHYLGPGRLIYADKV